MVASQLFRKENEHPQTTLCFSSFLRNQLGSAGLSGAELDLRASERLRFAQEEKVVASKVFRK